MLRQQSYRSGDEDHHGTGHNHTHSASLVNYEATAWPHSKQLDGPFIPTDIHRSRTVVHFRGRTSRR